MATTKQGEPLDTPENTDLGMSLEDAEGYLSAQAVPPGGTPDSEATSPGEAVLRAGDPDVSKLDASTVGEEAPGMGNPTPDQDEVDEIGEAVGITYADDEAVTVETKVSGRDRARWELDPASSEDFDERQGEIDRRK